MESKVKCKVVLLNTNKSTISKRHDGRLLYAGNYLIYEFDADVNHQPQHLYLVNDDEIKVGDYFLSDSRFNINQSPKYRIESCIDIENGWIYGNIEQKGIGHNPDWSKKIVATTDISLNLPIIPQSFIEKYVETNGQINEVMVESYVTHETGYDKFLCVKTRKDNTVIISKIKDSWNRDEVIDLLGNISSDTIKSLAITGDFDYEKWIETNL